MILTNEKISRRYFSTIGERKQRKREVNINWAEEGKGKGKRERKKERGRGSREYEATGTEGEWHAIFSITIVVFLSCVQTTKIRSFHPSING